MIGGSQASNFARALRRPTLLPSTLFSGVRFAPSTRCFRHTSARDARPVSRTRSSQNPLLPELPELFDPNFLDALIPPSPDVKAARVQVDASASNPMMDALHTFSHRTLTENGAQAYDSTLSSTLDVFNFLTHFTFGEQIGQRLDKAWAEDPAMTLKIIWNLRSIHEGKGEKEAFYRAFGWLYDKHPRTAITNLPLLVTPVCEKPGQTYGLAHGYWKDLLNILALVTVDELSNITRPAVFLHNKGKPKPKRRQRRNHPSPPRLEIDLKPVIKAMRSAVGVANHARLHQKLAEPKYRALYVAVARLFSERLLADWSLWKSGDQAVLRDISLAPKWAPSPLGTHDRHSNISTAIARLVYHHGTALELPSATFPSALKDLSLDTPEATDILRSYYRRWVLTPLRAATRVTETLMSANRWKDISYSGVSSVCMKNNKGHFFRHDPEGFQKYLISVEKGKRSITGATLKPHELIGELVSIQAESSPYPELQEHREAQAAMQRRVIEAQWNSLVQNLREAGTIDNAIAVCDVSGSMGYLHHYDPKNVLPIFPSVSLSLLLAQLAKPPFNSGFITFSQDPEFVRLDSSKGLAEVVEDMVHSSWGMNTDLNAVFMKLILPLAVKNKVKPEDMIKRVFVFSDMQFDSCVVHRGPRRPKSSRDLYVIDEDYSRPEMDSELSWESNYDRIDKAFEEHGYEVPEIVFWNLGAQGTVEVEKDRKGVAMMSGFSPAMLKVFMGQAEVAEVEAQGEGEDGNGEEKGMKKRTKTEFTPLNVMKLALEKECYAGLVVVD